MVQQTSPSQLLRQPLLPCPLLSLSLSLSLSLPVMNHLQMRIVACYLLSASVFSAAWCFVLMEHHITGVGELSVVIILCMILASLLWINVVLFVERYLGDLYNTSLIHLSISAAVDRHLRTNMSTVSCS